MTATNRSIVGRDSARASTRQLLRSEPNPNKGLKQQQQQAAAAALVAANETKAARNAADWRVVSIALIPAPRPLSCVGALAACRSGNHELT